MSEREVLFLDFETYYDKQYSLKKMSTPAYVVDRRFKVHGLAVRWAGKKGNFLPDDGLQDFFASTRVRQARVVMHNAFFDALVAKLHYGAAFAEIIDTRFMAHHVLGAAADTGESNDLATLAVRLGLKPKQRLEFMEGIEDPSPEEWDMLSVYANNDTRIVEEVHDILLPQVTRPEFEFWLMDHTVKMFLNRPLPLSREQIDAGTAAARKRDADTMATLEGVKVKVPVLIKGKKGRKTMPDEPDRTEIQLVEVDRSIIASNQQYGAVLKAVMQKKGRAVPTKRGKRGNIPALAKKDPEFREMLNDRDPLIQRLVRARLIVTSGNQVLARLAQLRQFEKQEGVLRFQLTYYGAHTGRFAGGGGFNVQNLTSPERANTPDERDAAASIRQCIVAPPGRVLVDVDAAAIEARVVAWLAGETKLVNAFAKGADIYSQFISKVLNEDIRKPKHDDDKDTAHYMKVRRQLGKMGVLGLGYCMGVDKFIRSVREDFTLGPLVGRELPTDLLAGVVEEYRSTYRRIVAYWRLIDEAFHEARQGGSADAGVVSFVKDGGTVHAVLPSGRTVRYSNIRRYRRPGEERARWMMGIGRDVYGGSLTENVVQAISRDILAEGIYSAEEMGWPIYLHVHDSLMSCVKESRGERCLADMVRILSTTPDWAKGLPLAAEGKVTKCMS